MAIAETKEREKHLDPMTKERFEELLEEMNENYDKAIKACKTPIIEEFIKKYSFIHEYDFTDEDVKKLLRYTQYLVFYAQERLIMLTQYDNQSYNPLSLTEYSRFIEHGIPLRTPQITENSQHVAPDSNLSEDIMVLAESLSLDQPKLASAIVNLPIYKVSTLLKHLPPSTKRNFLANLEVSDLLDTLSINESIPQAQEQQTELQSTP